ncbi:MAG: hypothetical protein R6V29_14350 [Spirochaetia bacterium]
MPEDVLQVIINSNQRGGRMLSLVDLIEADTLTIGMAARLTELIEAGSSLLVGAVPGGAGKTAVMGALLTMLPAAEPVHVTRDASRARGPHPGSGSSWRTAGAGECIVAYEISPASFEAYIWGQALREFVERGLEGARLVSNLHADTLEQAHDQLVEDNGVPAEHFNTFDLFVPIRVDGGVGRRTRVVEYVDYRDGESWTRISREPKLSPRAQEISAFFQDCLAEGTRRIEAVRNAWLAP